MRSDKAVLMAFAGGGEEFLVGYEDGALHGGPVRGEAPLADYPGLTEAVECASASPVHGQLAAAAGNVVSVWDIPSCHTLASLHHELPVHQCCVHSAGIWITADDWDQGRVWRGSSSGRLESSLIVIEGSQTEAEEIAIDRAGERIVCCSCVSWALYDITTSSVVAMHRPAGTRELAYMDGATATSENGAYFFLYWDDGDVLRTDTGESVRSFNRTLNPSVVRISDGGDRFAYGTLDGELLVRDQADRNLLSVDLGPEPLACLELAPDGSRVAFISADGDYGILDVASGKRLIGPEEVEARRPRPE